MPENTSTKLPHKKLKHLKITSSLLNADNLYQQVLESVVDGVSLSDESGIIQYTNPAEDKMFGYMRGELIGQHVSVQNTYPPKENQRIVKDVMQQLKKKGVWHGEFNNKKKDGSPFITSAHITALDIGGKPHWLCVQEDISARKQAEESLVYRTALLEAQNEATPDGILVVDTKGKMLSFNKCFAEMWKMPQEIMKAKDDDAALKFAMTQLADPEEFIARVNYLYAHPHKVSHEEVNLKDGRVFERFGAPVKNSNGHYYGWAWHFHDITHRKQHENRQAFLDSLSDMLFTSFEANGTIKKIARSILTHFADYCRIVTLDEDSNISEISVNHTDPSKVQLVKNLYNVYTDSDKAKQGIHKILLTGQSELIPIINEKTLAGIKNNPKMVQLIKKIGLKSYMGIPLVAQGKTIGAITFSSVRPGRIYTQEDLKFVQEVGRRIALALDNARLYKETENARQEAERQRLRLYDLFMQAPAMIAISRGPEHVYELANPMFLKVIGKSSAILGKPVLEVHPELKGQGIINILNNVYKHGKPFVGNEVPVKLDYKNTGTLEDRYFNFVYQPSKNAAGKVDGVLTHAIDVTDMVQVRKKVEQSESKYKSLFNSIDQGFAVIELQFNNENEPTDYLFLETNTLFETQTGITNAKGKSVKELIPGLEASWFKIYGKVALTGKSVRFVNSSEVLGRWFDVYAFRVGDHVSRKVAILFTDITERMSAEKQKEEAAQQIIDVLESMGDAVFMLDKDWNIIRVNKVHEKVTNTKRKEIIGKHFWDVFPAGPDSKYWIEHHKVMRTRKASHFIEYYEPLDLWTETDVYPTRDGGISVFFRDITSRQKAEGALRESEERLRFMSESLPQKVFTADSSGSIDYFNPQWMEYTGLTFEQIRDWGWVQFIHPDDVEENVRRWKQSIDTGELFEMEHRFKRYDGAYRWHISRAQAMKGQNGKIIRWFGSNTDVDDMRRTTKRKDELEEIAAMLTAQREELMELNKAKDEFISLASHQLRTPATGVKQYLGMTLEGYAGELNDNQKAFLHQAYESNERQINIVNDLLQVAKIDAGQVELDKANVELVPLIKDILEEQNTTFLQKNQKVLFKAPIVEYRARADSNRLRMVLENIIDNASKYTPNNKQIEIRLAKTEDFVKIVVKDQGVGVGKQDLDKIFDKFARIDNPLSVLVGGTGLGLYWAKKIIDLHGGHISVVSKLGSGSTFTIALPIK